MDNESHKNTWKTFTKFVLWGTVAVVMVLVLMAIAIKTSTITTATVPQRTNLVKVFQVFLWLSLSIKTISVLL